MSLTHQLSPEESNAAFEQFWKIYPRHEAKYYARKKWHKIKPDKATVRHMLLWVEQAKYSLQWQDLRFVPHASTWLNQRRWEGDPPPLQAKSSDIYIGKSEVIERDETAVQKALEIRRQRGLDRGI